MKKVDVIPKIHPKRDNYGAVRDCIEQMFQAAPEDLREWMYENRHRLFGGSFDNDIVNDILYKYYSMFELPIVNTDGTFNMMMLKRPGGEERAASYIAGLLGVKSEGKYIIVDECRIRVDANNKVHYSSIVYYCGDEDVAMIPFGNRADSAAERIRGWIGYQRWLKEK